MANETERLIHRANLQVEHQDLFGAIETLRRALTLDPDSAHAHAMLALCLHDQKRLHAAEHEAHAAIALAPELPFALYAMAVIAMAQRRFKHAEEHLQSALALDPTSTMCLQALGRLYTLWGRKHEALPLLERARDIDPDNPTTHAELADHYYGARDFERAEGYARKALEIDAANADALVTMGYLLLRRGEVAEAREHALIVLRHNASHEGAVQLLGAVKARQSLLLGAWWRFNSLFSGGAMSRRVLLLIGMFLAYRVAVIASGDLGYESAAAPLNMIWLGFCIYTWVGPAMFTRQIAKELAPTGVRSNY